MEINKGVQRGRGGRGCIGSAGVVRVGGMKGLSIMTHKRGLCFMRVSLSYLCNSGRFIFLASVMAS